MSIGTTSKRSRLSMPTFLGRSIDFTRPFESVDALCEEMRKFAKKEDFCYVDSKPVYAPDQWTFECSACKTTHALRDAAWRFHRTVSDDAPRFHCLVHSVRFSIEPDKDANGYLRIQVTELQEEHCCTEPFGHNDQESVNQDSIMLVERLSNARAKIFVFSKEQIETMVEIGALVKKLEKRF